MRAHYHGGRIDQNLNGCAGLIKKKVVHGEPDWDMHDGFRSKSGLFPFN
jgi:hypothetical protein